MKRINNEKINIRPFMNWDVVVEPASDILSKTLEKIVSDTVNELLDDVLSNENTMLFLAADLAGEGSEERLGYKKIFDENPLSTIIAFGSDDRGGNEVEFSFSLDELVEHMIEGNTDRTIGKITPDRVPVFKTVIAALDKLSAELSASLPDKD